MKAYLRQLICLAITFVVAQTALAQISSPSEFSRVSQDGERKIRQKLNPILTRYCPEACEIIQVAVEVDEKLTDIGDLGFEGIMGQSNGSDVFVSKATVEIQVDDRVTAVNRERMRTILMNNMEGLAPSYDILWRPVTLPQIGSSVDAQDRLKKQLHGRVARAIDSVIEKYCPETCVLSDVAVDGTLVTTDEAIGIDSKRLVYEQNGRGILRVDAVDVDVAMDLKLPEGRRKQIADIMRAKTKFAEPVMFDINAVSFPESFASLQTADREEDPYGLEKLRQMLIMFRDLAGTKEIINTTSTTTALNEKTSSRAATSQSLNDTQNATDPMNYLLIGGGIIGLVAILLLLYRILGAGPTYKAMREAAEDGRQRPAGMGAMAGGHGVQTLNVEGAGKAPSDENVRRAIALKLKCDDLKRDLTGTFMDMPRVAKETFARLLQDEGVEQTSRYVHIFGHIVIFELLDDPQLQRELYELSEYYHNSDVEVGIEEEYKLLQTLKNKVTANEIKVMTRRQLDQFDFLAKLDPAQIYNLITEEKPQMQSIVLTQLDHKRRRAVFDMYDGAPKVALMRELCRADAIPKEYLSNVAKALHKKVVSRPEFDTENLRSSDILLDLLEKASLVEQRQLMQNLIHTNPDAARGIKLKLVTIEMMPYLKDGHLLEIMLGMERQDLMTFFAGTREHIRGLILSKAPRELAESWVEDLNNMAGYDEQAYRLTEMKVLGRIRSLAANGAISLLDINDMIFGAQGQEVETESVEESTVGVDPGNMVA